MTTDRTDDGPVCRSEQGCHRVVSCDPGCGKIDLLAEATRPQSMTADRAALRDRIAAAIWERQNPGRRWADCEYRWRADAEADADAVLTVLPDRAAVLREAADRIDREDLPQDDVDMFDNGARWATKLLRRMAGETPATSPMTVYLSTPCDACHHTLNWHRNDVGCTVPLCVCGRFQEPAAGAWQDGSQP